MKNQSKNDIAATNNPSFEHASNSIDTKRSRMTDLACRLAKVGSWHLDISTMHVELSEEIFQIYDLEATDTPDLKGIIRTLQKSSKIILEAAYQLAIKQAQPFDLELDITTIKGNTKRIRSIGQPIVENGKVTHIEGVVQDVTKENFSIGQDGKLESILGSFFEANPDMYFIIDFDGMIHDYRSSKEDQLYVSPEQFLNKKVSEVMPPHITQLFEESFQLARKTKSVTNYEYELQLPDGVHYFECRISLLPNTPYCLNIIRDITDQYLAKEALKESEARYRNLIEKAPFPVLITRLRDARLRYINKRARDLLGFGEHDGIDLLAKYIYFEPDERQRFIDTLNQHGVVRDLEFKMRKWQGEAYWALMSASLVEFENEPAIITSINDITIRKKTEEALRVSEEKYRLLTEYTSDVIWVLNLEHEKFTYISPSIEQLRGFTVDEALAQNLDEALTPESVQIVMETISWGLAEFIQNPQDAKTLFMEVQQPCKNGDLVWVEVSTKLRFNQNNEVEVFGVSRNIDARKKMEQEVLFLSYHDQLTGLYNRRFFDEHIKQANDESNLPFTLIIADVNGLKLTNDAFGHIAGDSLLTTFSDILTAHCRSNDLIARVGGDEFVVLLPNTTEDEAEKIVNRVKAAILESNTSEVQLSVSFGWKTKYLPEQVFDIVFKQAEDFMYRNKLLESNSFKGKTVKVITNMLYERYPNEKAHGERVSKNCIEIGEVLGLKGDDLNELAVIGLLHDIGKIGIDEHIIKKASTLSDDEYKAIKRHPEIGYQILRSVTEYAGLADAVLSHHERIDGKGYPKGIKGHMIPTMAKILAIAEAFDTMMHPPIYHKSLTLVEAIEELKANAGTQFDPDITNIFIEKVLSKYENDVS